MKHKQCWNICSYNVSQIESKRNIKFHLICTFFSFTRNLLMKRMIFPCHSTGIFAFRICYHFSVCVERDEKVCRLHSWTCTGFQLCNHRSESVLWLCEKCSQTEWRGCFTKKNLKRKCKYNAYAETNMERRMPQAKHAMWVNWLEMTWQITKGSAICHGIVNVRFLISMCIRFSYSSEHSNRESEGEWKGKLGGNTRSIDRVRNDDAGF